MASGAVGLGDGALRLFRHFPGLALASASASCRMISPYGTRRRLVDLITAVVAPRSVPWVAP
jgi:hypothetical protein